MLDKVRLGIDFGMDSVKVAYAYVSNGRPVFDVLKFDELDSIPAVALYNPTTKDWTFGNDALVNSSSTKKPIVRIENLISKVGTSDYESNKFENPSCGYIFKAEKYTVKSVVESFFKFAFTNKLLDAIQKQFSLQGINNYIFDDEIVFTYSVDATDEYKYELQRLFKMCNLNIIRAVAEPLAASLSMTGFNKLNYSNVLVVDIGCKQTSFAVFNPSFSSYKDGKKDLAISSKLIDWVEVGGDDFDKVIVDLAFKLSDRQEDLTEYQKFMLNEQAKKIKKRLNEKNYAVVQFESEVTIPICIRKKEFVDASESIVSVICKKINDIVSNLDNNVGYIELIGGAAAMPFVKDAVSVIPIVNKKNIDVLYSPDALYLTAKGAAVESTGLAKLEAITTCSYGVKCSENTSINSRTGIKIVVPRNSTVPIKITRCFKTKGSQSSANLVVYAVNSTQDMLPLSKGKLIYETELVFNKSVGSGYPFDLTFEIDSSGMVHMKADSHGNGRLVESFKLS